MESLALLVTIMILISLLGAPIGWAILKIPTRKPSTTIIKKITSFIFTLFGLMIGTSILMTGHSIGGLVIAIISITASIYVLIKIWLDKTYWEH